MTWAVGMQRLALLMCALCLAAAATITIAAPASAQSIEERRMALTFDDAPRVADAFLTRSERAEALLAHLSARGVSAAFFANTNQLDAEGLAILRRYGEAGHVIANHTHTHQRLRAIGADAYLADLDRADETLRRLPGFAPFFRFPYLDEGATPTQRDQVRAGLAARGYRAGYVTIDTYDWYINSLANRAVRESQALDRSALGALYVEVLVSAVEHYDAVAQRYLGRSPAHVLLLHENDMAALYVGDLIDALRARGWTIVSPFEAYADPIASREPDTMFLNQGRVAALARERGAEPAELVSPQEEEAWLDAQFAARVALSAPAH